MVVYRVKLLMPTGAAAFSGCVLNIRSSVNGPQEILVGPEDGVVTHGAVCLGNDRSRTRSTRKASPSSAPATQAVYASM